MLNKTVSNKENRMKVSISTAAKMVGVERSTFYRHVKEKGITLEDTNSKRPKVVVSELIRVYGDKIKTPEQLQKELNDNVSDKTISNTSIDEKIELGILKERLRHYEQLHTTEKTRLEEQIEMLKEMLQSEKDERKKATALLTDQRSEKDRISELQKSIQDLSDRQSRGLLQRLFGRQRNAA